jgi:hypothetical protein
MDLALARYGVIALLVSRTLSRSECGRESQAALAALHRFPEGERRVGHRTVNRWVEWYREGCSRKRYLPETVKIIWRAPAAGFLRRPGGM